MYHVFENSNVPLDIILQIGEIIHYDFSDEIKELKKYKSGHPKQEFKESESAYNKSKEEIEYWKNKYLELLEEYNQLLSKLAGKLK